MKLIIVVCLLAVCYAQPQPKPCDDSVKPPMIAETFEATTQVHRREHDRPEFMGRGKWSRSENMKEAMDSVMFTLNGTQIMEERLWLFDKHMEYNIMGTRCQHRPIPPDAQFPMVWEWLQKAHCMEVTDPRSNKTYDSWETRDQRGTTRLFVDGMMPNKPIAIIRTERGEEEDMRFTTFEPMEPPASDFMVPPSCQMKRH